MVRDATRVQGTLSGGAVVYTGNLRPLSRHVRLGFGCGGSVLAVYDESRARYEMEGCQETFLLARRSSWGTSAAVQGFVVVPSLIQGTYGLCRATFEGVSAVGSVSLLPAPEQGLYSHGDGAGGVSRAPRHSRRLCYCTSANVQGFIDGFGRLQTPSLHVEDVSGRGMCFFTTYIYACD